MLRCACGWLAGARTALGRRAARRRSPPAARRCRGPTEALNAWSGNISKLLTLVEKTCQQVGGWRGSGAAAYRGVVQARRGSWLLLLPAWLLQHGPELPPLHPPAPHAQIQKESMVHRVPIGTA